MTQVKAMSFFALIWIGWPSRQMAQCKKEKDCSKLNIASHNSRVYGWPRMPPNWHPLPLPSCRKKIFSRGSVTIRLKGALSWLTHTSLSRVKGTCPSRKESTVEGSECGIAHGKPLLKKVTIRLKPCIRVQSVSHLRMQKTHVGPGKIVEALAEESTVISGV